MSSVSNQHSAQGDWARLYYKIRVAYFADKTKKRALSCILHCVILGQTVTDMRYQNINILFILQEFALSIFVLFQIIIFECVPIWTTAVSFSLFSRVAWKHPWRTQSELVASGKSASDAVALPLLPYGASYRLPALQRTSTPWQHHS